MLEAGMMIRMQLDGVVDLVLINKFGKSESEGGGLRDVIVEAFARQIPVLVGVPLRNEPAWQDFSGHEAARLEPCFGDVMCWLEASGLKPDRPGSAASG